MPFNDSGVNFMTPSIGQMDQSGQEENFDEFLEFGDNFPLDDGGFGNATWNLAEFTPPYDDGLYTGPMPDSQQKVNPMPVLEKQRPMLSSWSMAMPQAEQERLHRIAMPDAYKLNGQYSPQSASSIRTGSIPSPDSQDKNRKRKSSSSADEEDEEDDEGKDGHAPPMKKTAHNMIEKRYRTNLNDKIAALRDSVPSLREAVRKNGKGEPDAEIKEDLQGLTPAHKLNKATVLSKATEYIRHLEKQRDRLKEENTQMKKRIAAFERLFMSGSVGLHTSAAMNPYTQEPVVPIVNNGVTTPGVSPPGMIQVPEDMRALHAANDFNQQVYPVPQENYQNGPHIVNGANGWNNGGRMFGKMMVGSLAALMLLEGFTENEQEGDGTNARGLFALPTQLAGYLGHHLRNCMNFNVLGYHYSPDQTASLLRLLLVFGVVLYVFIPSFFDKPKSSGRKSVTGSLVAPSPASPIQVRQQAWLTATQTIWVPRHNFFLEAAALCIKMAKLSLRNAVGWYGYSLLTGLTEQQEIARVKAWSIALDAQLAGGDMEINKSRLILTLIASGTIPDTPALLMLKALHVRVLLWEFGKAGFNHAPMFKELTTKLARWKWNEAKQLQQLLERTGGSLDGQAFEPLPKHLAALLEHEYEAVFGDAIAQRAYNLAFNLPTSRNSPGSSEGMDEVVNDFAVRSPLDAAAAWFSSLVLHGSLSTSLSTEEEPLDDVLEDINTAVDTAPVGSGAHIRAIIARALLSKDTRDTDVATASRLISPAVPGSTPDATLLMNATIVTAPLPDLKIALDCCKAIALLEEAAPVRPEEAYRIIRGIQLSRLSLLGFTAALKLMSTLASRKEAATACVVSLEKLAGELRIWIGGKMGQRSNLPRETKERIVKRCLNVTKHCIGMQKDAGYESMSDAGN